MTNPKMIIYACHGVSASGQLTTQASFELQDRNIGTVGCLAGLGAGIQHKVEAARTAEKVIVLEGCGLRCVRTMLEKARINSCTSFLVPESKIKVAGKKPSAEEINRFADYVENQIKIQ